jgi:hypothetical protein
MVPVNTGKNDHAMSANDTSLTMAELVETIISLILSTIHIGDDILVAAVRIRIVVTTVAAATTY